MPNHVAAEPMNRVIGHGHVYIRQQGSDVVARSPFRAQFANPFLKWHHLSKFPGELRLVLPGQFREAGLRLVGWGRGIHNSFVRLCSMKVRSKTAITS